MRKQFTVAIVAIMLLSVLTVTLTCLPTIVSATPWTPVEWQDDGKLKNWVRDQNGNFVDDLIEAQTGKVDIIVDLNGCIGEPANSEIVKYLNTLGDVVYVGKYVSFIIVKGVEGDRCVDIANRPEVAMVELATTDKWLGDNFRASKFETSATYHPNTLQNAFGWPVERTGKDINIAFLDSGANSIYDPYVTHGYDAINNVEINPGPGPIDHASDMASWVFGLGGIAPRAELVDIKVGNASGADSAAVMRALEKVYEKQRDWGINVVVMMFGGNASLDGRETRQQLIDLLSGQGIVVVASTGDNINNAPVTGPGAATRAIGVSAANITNTVDRGDDVAPYVQGPRMDDGDMDLLDELKPEVIMPTGESDTAVSNSIATAMTSGLVALILEANSGLRNFDNKASGSVKDLLIRSAEPKGTADTTVEYPRSTPTWDQYWGFGEIDAFEAFQYLSGQVETGRTDLTFMGFDGTSHPSSPWYYSHAVETQSERDGRNIEAGVPDSIFARVYNNGSPDAHNVRVSFGFYPFTAGIPKFYDIGSVVTDIEGFSDEIVSIEWTPPTLPAGEDHGCIFVTIDYGLDSMFSGGSNFAQKNVQVQPASSPAVFTFRVENPLPTKAKIDLNVRTEPCKHKDWTIKLSKTSFTMEPYECARTVQATVEPPAHVKPGTEALFFVTAYATAMGQEKGVEIGGVALKALGPTQPPGKPDLVIKDIKLTKLEGYCYVDYLISNTGTVSASASTTYLYVDGKKVASDSTSALASGASRWDRFTYRTTGAHTFKVCADGHNAISETNEANNCRTEKLTCPVKLDIYFADGGESPGSVYHYNTTTGIEETVYTRPSRRLYSFSFHPHIPEKLYYVNANENKIYRTLQLPSGWTTEEVVYTHTTYVRDMAFAFGKDGELRLYFSEATGAGGNGKIYKIEDGTASLYYKVKLADVGGSWAGDFAFDDKGKLYLSSGNRVPASIYKVEGERVKEIFRDEKEPITGLVYEDGALYYVNWRTKIYHLDLSTGGRTAIYSNSARTWISDVGFREVITPVPAKKPDLVITDISRSDNRIIYGIKNQGNAAAGPSTTYLYVDGSYKASDSIGSMPAGGTLSRSFEYAYTCTPHRDTIKVCADATKKVTESNEANNCKTEVWACEAPPRKLDIYFADAKEWPGSVYHYDTTTGIEETVYTRPSRQLFSFTFHPGIPEKLYYVNAIENKIYRTHQTGLGWAPEEVVYTHTTNVKDIAFAFDKDGKLGLYFSEGNKIYKIEDSKASLYYEAELADFADVDGFWFGYFAFDDKNNLYLSSANRVPAGIYKVEGGEIKEIFRDEKEPITGLVYEDGALYYANHGTKIYRLDLTTGERTVVYSNPERMWLTDVGFREVITPEKPDLAYIYSTDTTSANSYKSLLDANGYITTLIPMRNVATTDFSTYSLIIVGGDTGSGYHWGDSVSVSAIQDSEKTIIGLYSGGASLFQELGLSINWGHGMFFTETGIYVVEPNHTIFKSPNAIPVPPDKIVQLYSSPCSVLGEYASCLSPEVRLLGRGVTYKGHYPLVQERQNVFWGFTASPESMTEVGKDLFINVVSYMTE